MEHTVCGKMDLEFDGPWQRQSACIAVIETRPEAILHQSAQRLRYYLNKGPQWDVVIVTAFGVDAMYFANEDELRLRRLNPSELIGVVVNAHQYAYADRVFEWWKST